MYKLYSFSNVADTVAASDLCFDELAGALAYVAYLAEDAFHDMDADLKPLFMRHTITKGFSAIVFEHTVSFYSTMQG